MKFLQLVIPILILQPSLIRAEEEPASHPGRLTLAGVRAEALRSNPSIKAARAKWRMMKERVPQAAAWPDPLVGMDVERFGSSQFGEWTDVEWMAMQEIPISGKNRSRARIADAEALATWEELRRVQLDVVAAVKAAYFNLANAREQLAVNQGNIDLLTRFTDISRMKYESGTQAQGDVLLAETETAQLTEARRDLERAFSDAQTRLNVLMNRKPDSPLGRAELRFTHFEAKPERLEAIMLASRPELLAARQNIAGEKAKLQLAKRQWFPDPQIRVEARDYYGDGSGITEYDTGVFFSIPWPNFKKYSAGEREARSGIEMSEGTQRVAENDAFGMLRDQLKKIATLHHHYELFRDQLLPLAQQTVEANQAGYESDKAGFLDLLTAQRRAQDIEAAYFMHLTDYLAALAELEAIIGADPNKPQNHAPPAGGKRKK